MHTRTMHHINSVSLTWRSSPAVAWWIALGFTIGFADVTRTSTLRKARVIGQFFANFFANQCRWKSISPKKYSYIEFFYSYNEGILLVKYAVGIGTRRFYSYTEVILISRILISREHCIVYLHPSTCRPTRHFMLQTLVSLVNDLFMLWICRPICWPLEIVN